MPLANHVRRRGAGRRGAAGVSHTAAGFKVLFINATTCASGQTGARTLGDEADGPRTIE